MTVWPYLGDVFTCVAALLDQDNLCLDKIFIMSLREEKQFPEEGIKEVFLEFLIKSSIHFFQAFSSWGLEAFTNVNDFLLVKCFTLFASVGRYRFFFFLKIFMIEIPSMWDLILLFTCHCLSPLSYPFICPFPTRI